MKKLILVLLAVVTGLSFACNLDLVKDPIMCGGKALTNKSTYADFNNCKVESVKKKHFKQVYKLEFTDDNKQEYECFFADTKATTVVKNCKLDD